MNNTIGDSTLLEKEKALTPFWVSLFLPLSQIVIIPVGIFLSFYASSLHQSIPLLIYSILAICIMLFISDIIGIIIAARGIRRGGDENCTFPLMLNIFFCFPKALALLLLLLQVF